MVIVCAKACELARGNRHNKARRRFLTRRERKGIAEKTRRIEAKDAVMAREILSPHVSLKNVKVYSEGRRRAPKNETYMDETLMRTAKTCSEPRNNTIHI